MRDHECVTMAWSSNLGKKSHGMYMNTIIAALKGKRWEERAEYLLDPSPCREYIVLYIFSNKPLTLQGKSMSRAVMRCAFNECTSSVSCVPRPPNCKVSSVSGANGFVSLAAAVYTVSRPCCVLNANMLGTSVMRLQIPLRCITYIQLLRSPFLEDLLFTAVHLSTSQVHINILVQYL